MYKHGMKGMPLYNCWVAMKSRCYNPNHKNYKDYGGRGITVCPEWLNPCNFFAWAESHGYREDLSLDRIDNEKGYSPENCRWVTQKQQLRNTRRNRRISYKGETHCLSEWAELTAISYPTLKARYYAGWTPKQILTIPVSRSNTGLRIRRKTAG